MTDKFLIFSDIQFYNNPSKSYILPNGRSSWLQTQLDVAEQIFKIAKERDINLIIHNGDMFEEKTRINVGLYNAVWQFFMDKASEGFVLYLNTGNHDMLSNSESSLKPFSSVGSVITKPFDTELSNTVIRIIPYGQIENNLKLPSSGKINVLCTHEDIAGLKLGPNDYESGSPIKYQILGDWDIVFNGHIHKPQELKNIVNIGSPVINDWGEFEDEKRVIIYEEGKWESIPIDGPKFIQLDRLTDKLKKKLETNTKDFFRIDVDSSELKDPIFDKFNIFPRVVKTSKRTIRLKNTDSIEEEIKTYVDNDENTQLNKNRLKQKGLELYNNIKEK